MAILTSLIHLQVIFAVKQGIRQKLLVAKLNCRYTTILRIDCNAIKMRLLYSVRKLLTGFAIAAFIAWKLIVIKAIVIIVNPVIANTHHSILIR